ncbi:Glycosyltransferase, GT2 family [Actinopolyspora xinjiangensis]|uniref:Glycosyltransferase, GT2 family n=1 Tax=Actinopolyspora xinjiangensis TaxID=405564 RepID=A0A1H0WZD1_9ACTN|nr:glycosyltransferase [Actinopolyspora xinjiangensis]SDP96094.1 Glycosyltransferase, GT2 family [Actinopolyspora xinjiangensis]
MSDNGGPATERPRRLIEWTGERCVPWSDDARVIYEHYHRYALAARLVRGKRVLDLASGEGFGAAMLATQASEVVGVDIDRETVRHAASNYTAPNLTFHTGSITDPEVLSDAGSFDVVVCFEAIEHVAEHDAVLRLVRARLASGGLLLISTPDTAVYHDEHGNDNPFHVKELAAPQFEALLRDSFRHVAMLKQNVAVGSLVTPADPGDPDTAADGVRLQTMRQLDSGGWEVRQGVDHTYLLGLASDRQLPQLPAAAVLLDADLKLARADAGQERREVLEQRDAAVADVARLNELFRTNRAEAEELKRTIGELESARGAAESRAVEAERERDALRAELHEVRSWWRRESARNEWLRETVGELESELDKAGRRVAELTEQNSALVQRAVTRYRNVVERIAPRGTTRRDVYEIAMGRGTSASQVTTERGPVAVPYGEQPEVSVIVPVHGEWDYTRRCLRSLAGHRASAPFEVVVVDDASPDDSAELLARCPGVRLVRTGRNLGFVGACNLGAEHARGHYLFFLNNDAEVTESWLDELLAAADSDERIGLVGARLLYPDGRMQECGSVVWSDGTGWNLGRLGDPDAPEYAALRDVDYCSGAALLVRRELFDSLGGFDTRYSPAYYEDTDLAFGVRAAGYRTVVQPRAVVVHHEGVSNGTETGSGVKRHQELNRRSFVAKWEDTLREQHLPEADTRALWLARERGTHGHFGPLVLVKDHQVPRPDHDSGSVRMWRVLERLVALGARVVFFPDNHAEPRPYTEDLRRLGVTVLARQEHQHAFLAEAGSEITLALLSRPQVAWSLVERLRVDAPDAVIAYDTVDMHFVRLGRQAELAEARSRTSEAEALRRRAFASRQSEIGLVRSCDVTLVVSEDERRMLTELVDDADVRVLSNVHEVRRANGGPEGRADVLFVGGFDHPPNVDAAEWAVREIMPLVWRECPSARLHVVGSNPPPEVNGLHGPGVEVHGWVDDLAGIYDRVRVTLAPLRFGAGVKGKVGESLAAGVPVVGTNLALEGISLTPDRDVPVADDAAGLASRLVRVLTDDTEWSRLSEVGGSAVAEQFGPEVCERTLRELLSLGVRQT